MVVVIVTLAEPSIDTEPPTSPESVIVLAVSHFEAVSALPTNAPLKFAA
jgi:hypothetical protein